MKLPAESSHPYWLYIYGFNITIVGGLFVVLFSRLLGRYKGALATGRGIAAYKLMVGAEQAVVRAALMGELSLIARLVCQRQVDLDNLAGVASALAGLSG